MSIGVWPRSGWWSVATNWKGHPRYVFIGWWLSYMHSVTMEWGDWDRDIDHRHLRLWGREFEWVRPLRSPWARYWSWRIARGIHRDAPPLRKWKKEN